MEELDGRKDRYEKRTSVDALIYLVVVPKYLAYVVLKLARNVTRDNKKNKINSRHVLLAAKNDEKLKIASRSHHC